MIWIGGMEQPVGPAPPGPEVVARRKRRQFTA